VSRPFCQDVGVTSSEGLPMAEDDALVVRARHSREAFAILFDDYYPRVLRYCCLRLGHRHSAEDATSDVFLQVARSIKSFVGESDIDFRRWLFRIASNIVNSQFRKTRIRRETACTVEVASKASSVIDRAEDWASVTQAMQQLDGARSTWSRCDFWNNSRTRKSRKGWR
jgi:RNA polymerase sigma factor (sigma-70 family)